LFDAEEYRDLEIWVRGHSRSLEMAPFYNSNSKMLQDRDVVYTLRYISHKDSIYIWETLRSTTAATEWCSDKVVWRGELSVDDGKLTVLQKMWRCRVNCCRSSGRQTKMSDRSRRASNELTTTVDDFYSQYRSVRTQ